MLALTKCPKTRIWNAPTAVAKLATGGLARFGIKGQADLTGISHGFRLEVECKTGSGALTKEQESWRRMIESHGGIYIVARSADEAVAFLDAAVHLKLHDDNNIQAMLASLRADLEKADAYAEWVQDLEPSYSFESFLDAIEPSSCDTVEADAETDQ